MRNLISGLALVAALGIGACAGMAPGGYSDMEDDEDIAVAGAAIPQLPPPPGSSIPPPYRPPTNAIPPPLSIPAPPPPAGATPRSPSTPIPGPPAAAPAPPGPPAPRPAVCTAPNISLRTEASGAVEIKCGRPPTAPPAGLRCNPPQQVAYLTRNGVSDFRCM